MRRLGAEATWRQRAGRIALRTAYWLAVLAVSIAILIGLILFLESRDSSQVGHGKNGAGVVRVPAGATPGGVGR
jgi:hypothetical protein